VVGWVWSVIFNPPGHGTKVLNLELEFFVYLQSCRRTHAIDKNKDKRRTTRTHAHAQAVLKSTWLYFSMRHCCLTFWEDHV